MTIKTIIEGKQIRICDICGEEIELDSKDNLSLSIQQSWWKTFGYKNIEICKKHRKEMMTFIKKLKLEVIGNIYENPKLMEVQK